MTNDWITIFTTDRLYQAEFIKETLEINKIGSSNPEPKRFFLSFWFDYSKSKRSRSGKSNRNNKISEL